MTKAPESRNPTEMPSLLLLLDDSPALCKLIAAWPNAFRAGAKKHEQVETWAQLTGLRPLEVARAWRLLLENGFVNRDGTVDEVTGLYLTGLGLARIPKKKGES